MTEEKKLELALEALAKVAVSTEDSLTSKYCAMILLEMNEFKRIEELIHKQKAGSN